MATRKKAVIKAAGKAEVVEDAVIVREPEGLDDSVDDNEPDEVAIRRILSGLGDDSAGVLVTVYRIDDKNQKEYLYECSPDDFSLDSIRDDWGSGKYRIYARNNSGHFVLNRVVRIAAPRQANPLEQPRVDLMSVITTLGEQQAKAAEAMRAMMLEVITKTQPAAQAFDPAAMMSSVVATMGAVQKMMGGNEKADPVEMLLKGLDLADRFGSSDRDTGMFDVMKEIVKQTAGPLAKAAEASIDSQATRPRPPNRVEAPATEAVKPALDHADAAMQQLGKNLGLVLDQAKRNSSTDLWAEIIIDQIPDGQLDSFVGLISLPDVIDRMVRVNPEVELYRPWFKELVETMRWHLFDQGEGAGLTGEQEGVIDVDDNQTQQGKHAVTGSKGAADGPVSGKSGDGSDA